MMRRLTIALVLPGARQWRHTVPDKVAGVLLELAF
jgi:hypothetical protein